MLARRIRTIQPAPTLEEAIETTMVRSVAGLLNGAPLVAAMNPCPRGYRGTRLSRGAHDR